MFLETKRLILRKFQEEDFADFCAYAMDEEMCRMMGNDLMDTEEAARITFDWLKDKEERSYVLVLKETGRAIGNLNITPLPEHLLEQPALTGKQGKSLSFCISRQYQRQGLMSEAVEATAAHLFDEEGMDYVQCGYFAFNAASEALQKKLGFVHLTTMTLDYRGEKIVTAENVLWKK
ncbi:MAG: GNAT family N-acetyltransferase [Oscillospiraceae bacterium]|nr:GNAT family N-acetyltransferase [Oscillospiraceae bacterium]